MTPLLLIVVGVGALVVATLLLRSFGPRFRVGRLLATTPAVSVADAVGLAQRGERRYVRVQGRIDAEDEFHDQDHRPLVFRRTRLAFPASRGWTTIEDGREQVAFEVHEGLDAIGVDGSALDAGLIVVPRVSEGRAGDLGDRAPDDLAAATPVRVTIEQVSSVEHAIVLGVPAIDEGRATMTRGLGRPLVLTTLEPTEAMRLLTGGRTGMIRAAAGLLAGGLAMVVVGGLWVAFEAVT